jgi:phage/plasmid-like protein (TIGR03299 family)
MAHELSISADGRAEAFYALTPAWHGLGTVVDKALCSAEAIQAAHLEWEVIQKPIYTQTDQQTLTGGQDYAQVAGWCANVRADTGAALGVVTSRYKPVQNVEAFDFVDGLVQDGIIKYESAGAMRGGRVVWLLAKMPQRQEVAEGDSLDQFILFTNTHDGSRAALILPTSVRVVCMNTLRLALAGSRGKALRIRHTGEIDSKLDEARAALGIATEQFSAHLETSRKLAGRKIQHREFIDYLDRIIPLEKDPAKKRANSGREEVRGKIKDNYYIDPRQQLAAIRGTAWAAFNSVTHYVDHQLPSRGGTSRQKADNAFYSVTLGHGNDIKQEAYRAAVEMFAGA